MLFLGKDHKKSSKLSHHARKFAAEASKSIYQHALDETKKDLGDAIDSAVQAYTEQTIGGKKISRFNSADFTSTYFECYRTPFVPQPQMKNWPKKIVAVEENTHHFHLLWKNLLKYFPL